MTYTPYDLEDLRRKKAALAGERQAGARGRDPDKSGSDHLDTAELLDRVVEILCRFVVLPSTAAVKTLALYVLHTWTIAAANATLYIVFVSAEKQSGKTRGLEVLALVVREPWHTLSATEAALFRKIEQDEPCLLLDEIDAIFGSNSERTEPLRAVLNAGNRRGAKATRVVGQGTKMAVRDFSVFSPKVLAGIDTGRLPETVQDRAVVLRMKRRHAGERVERLRFRFVEPEATALRNDLKTWADAATDGLRDAIPELPDGLSDRAGDAWEPLFAIADLAAGDWPAQARVAALELSATNGVDEVGRGAQLLSAIKAAMDGRPEIPTAELLEQINGDDEMPFGAWRNGQGLDPRGLARLLKPYEVKSTTIRVGDKTPKGYRADDLRDAWARYLPPSEAQQAQQAQHDIDPPHENARKHGDVADVADVADLTGSEGDVADDADTDAADGRDVHYLESLFDEAQQAGEP
jgi:hypothetical protein